MFSVTHTDRRKTKLTSNPKDLRSFALSLMMVSLISHWVHILTASKRALGEGNERDRHSKLSSKRSGRDKKTSKDGKLGLLFQPITKETKSNV